MKTDKTPKTAKVFHFDLYGRRQDKYDFLNQYSLTTIPWTVLEPTEPNFFLVQKNFDQSGQYEEGFKIDELLKLNSTGIKTHRDELVLDYNKVELQKRIEEFYNLQLSDEIIANKFKLKDNRDWNLSRARQINTYKPTSIVNIEYRPLDKRFCYFLSTD